MTTSQTIEEIKSRVQFSYGLDHEDLTYLLSIVERYRVALEKVSVGCKEHWGCQCPGNIAQDALSEKDEL